MQGIRSALIRPLRCWLGTLPAELAGKFPTIENDSPWVAMPVSICTITKNRKQGKAKRRVAASSRLEELVQMQQTKITLGQIACALAELRRQHTG